MRGVPRTATSPDRSEIAVSASVTVSATVADEADGPARGGTAVH
jgi:hypothetical protein